MTADADGFVEAGVNHADPIEEVSMADVISVPNPEDNPKYKGIVSQLRQFHGDLLRMEQEGKLGNYQENPALIGDYLGKLRLNANMLFAFLNAYIDIESDMTKDLAEKRQRLFEERLSMPKGTPSAADTYSKSMTRTDEASLKIVQNRIQQIKNEYERYNGICMYLQSRLKEFNTERIMG